MFNRRAMTTALLAASTGLCTLATAQLRVVNWNVTNYSSGRVAEFQTAFYGVVPSGLDYAGYSMAPDVVIAEEILSQAGVNNFLSLLNTAPGSPGDWAAAPFIDGPDTDCGFFYRTSKVVYIQTKTISLVTGSTSLPPRNTYRYDVRLVGYANSAPHTLACYATHMKSSDSSTDQARRLLEANKIRDNANGLDTNGPGTALPAGWNFLIGGDFNIQSSSQAAYQRMVGSETNNNGRFWDPINTPGSWNNNGAFRFVHTQDPSTTGSGGMDDRHDQILIGTSLTDGTGLDYIGNISLPYSTTTWNDPNHSYRCWGNDGSTYNLSLATTNNTMVGPAIAQALITTTNAGASSGGHLPVFLDLRVPAKVTSQSSLNFGQVPLNAPAVQTLNVSNSGDVSVWGVNGIDALNYSLSASSGFTAPAGSFIDLAGGTSDAHSITMDTSTAGIKSGTLIITSDASEEPSRLVTLSGEVLGGCPADFNGDTGIDFFDYLDFVAAFSNLDPTADFNGDGGIDFFDYLDFVAAFSTGC
jgi:hypothetical protein